MQTPSPWLVVEIWRATGSAARPAGWGPLPPVPSAAPAAGDDADDARREVSPPLDGEDGDLDVLSLVFGAGCQRGCYSPMRAPRGHACARCLEDPTAKMLRVASHYTFSPGIGLVGRVWLLGVAEVVDLPAIGASST